MQHQPHTKPRHGALRTLRALALAALMAAPCATATAQRWWNEGVAFGVDRDTLLWLIASPFDNWWLNVSGGVQTFYGNEQDAEARRNPARPGVRAELGKWVLPDLALSLRFGAFPHRSQGCYAGKNPWLDKTHDPVAYSLGYQYYTQSVHGIQALGIVTLDWTNFFSGYERGKRRQWHLYTPVGMGGIWLYGKQINPTADPTRAGTVRWNKELAFTGGVQTEYYTRSDISFNAALELLGTRGTVDWTYTQDDPAAPHKHRIVDWIPSFYVGMKINLVHHAYKRDPYTHRRTYDTVYHEFQTVGSRHSIERLHDSIALLEREVADAMDRAADLGDDTAQLHALVADNLDKIKDLEDRLAAAERPYDNIMQVLKDLVDDEGLPATIVYYKLDKFDLDLNAHRKLRNFAREMSDLPDTLQFYIIGAADSLTGSRRHNDWLSERRCEAAFNSLVGDYGANADQFTLVPVGGITAYEPKEDNRMAMVILRSPKVDAAIRQWSRYKQ